MGPPGLDGADGVDGADGLQGPPGPQGPAGGGGGTISTAAIAFTDGDTMRRIRITDASATTTSKIVGTIRRPDVAADVNDAGAFIYMWTIVNRVSGAFDIWVAATEGFGDPWLNPPNETVQFDYMLG